VQKRKKGNLIVISAPSGSGKTTLCRMLLREDSDVVRSVSLTTRPIRSGEEEGEDYYFIPERSFIYKKKKGELLESARVHGYYYGTPRRFVEKLLQQGKDVLLAIDVQGALQVRGKYSDSILIFLLPPSLRQLKERLLKRGREGRHEIEGRIKASRRELKQIKRYDYLVINDRLKKALCQLKAILVAERCSIQ
jgi:guanylate kinase